MRFAIVGGTAYDWSYTKLNLKSNYHFYLKGYNQNMVLGMVTKNNDYWVVAPYHETNVGVVEGFSSRYHACRYILQVWKIEDGYKN